MDDTEINNGDEEEFEFSRNYFLAKELAGSGKKSTHKLSDINAIAEEELRIAMSKLEPLHEKESKALMDSYRSLYTQWIFELRCGFGLLMYGFGSKKALIEDFAAKVLTDYPVIVINGFLQSINFKQFLVALAELLWDELRTTRKQAGNLTKAQQPSSSKSIDELLDFLDGPYVEENDCFVCVLVHNIDGPCLRDSETQQYLAKMAACSHVRIVASVDHVNAPLLWDKKMVHTQFNWFWHHVPTYAPYSIEGTFYPLILTHGGTSQSAKTALIVLQSLSSNARSIFKLLAEYLLSHPDEEGMPTSDLYTISRERFLVSNQVTLNSHLTEFRDHQLVKTRKNPDGQDCLYILLSRDAIGKLLPEIDP